jgi:hypothetical protein
VDADVLIYRLYNSSSKEHLYTKDKNEYTTLGINGWSKEGVGWIAPDTGTPIYRLYSPVTGGHLYTKNASEKETLIKSGWKDEKILAYSGGTAPIYRAYNSSIKQHNFTVSLKEQKHLISVGWKNEGTGFYGKAYVQGWDLVDSGGHSDVIYSDSKYSSYIQKGMSSWNNIKSGVFRKDSASTVHDVYISDTVLAAGTNARTFSNGTIQFNIELMDAKSSARKQHIATHELGHALGIDHVPIEDDVMHKYDNTTSTISGVDEACFDVAEKRY